MSASKHLPSHLETEHLLLRPLREDDLDFFIGLHGDREVIRFLGGTGEPRTPEATEAWLAKMIRWYSDDALGPYALVRRSDDSLVGRSGLSIFEIEKTPSSADGIPIATWGIESADPGVPVVSLLELGYVVHPSAWGEGFATEASRAWLAFAFEERHEQIVHSVIAPGNAPSLRVAQKNGLSKAGTDVRMDGSTYGVFRRERASWK